MIFLRKNFLLCVEILSGASSYGLSIFSLRKLKLAPCLCFIYPFSPHLGGLHGKRFGTYARNRSHKNLREISFARMPESRCVIYVILADDICVARLSFRKNVFI